MNSKGISVLNSGSSGSGEGDRMCKRGSVGRLIFRLACIAAMSQGISVLAQTALEVYRVDTGNIADIAGVDCGSVAHYPLWDRWMLFYGAQTNIDNSGLLPPAPPNCPRPLRARTAVSGSTAEDLWLTWSSTDGRVFGQCEVIAPPMLVLSQGEFRNYYGSTRCPNPTDRLCDASSGANIGDAAFGIGPSGRWYLFFDTQCAGPNCPGGQNEWGITLAATMNWTLTPWPILGQPSLPGTAPYPGLNGVVANFPSVFTDPSHASEPNRALIVYYQKTGSGTMAGAYLHDPPPGPLTVPPVFEPLGGDVFVNFTPLPQPNCGAAADRISVFYHAGDPRGPYYAVADDAVGCANPQVGLQNLWLFGPNPNPWGFDWNTKRPILSATHGTFYDWAVQFPNAIGPDYTGDGTTRVYFSAVPSIQAPDTAFNARVGVLELAFPTPTFFYTVTPCRILDTRNPTGPLGGPALAAGETRTFTVTGACGIPAGARSLSVNYTVVAPPATGDLLVLPGGDFVSQASSISVKAGLTRANNGLIALSSGGSGRIKVRNNSAGAVNFVVDVNGYFQ